MDRVIVHDSGDRYSLIEREEKIMKTVIYQLCTKLAACALFAAILSVGTASCNSMYQPELPKQLER